MNKIAKPGLYAGVPMSDYHGDLCAGPSISSSGLRTIYARSPAHYYETSYLNPNKSEQVETEAFTLGRAAHHLLLGEEAFSTLFITRPPEIAGKPWQGNRTECKAWLDKQRKESRSVLTPDNIEQIRGMARGLSKHPLIEAGILNGGIEQTMAWVDEETGAWVKGRPDAIPNQSGDFADLKTCVSVEDDALRKSMAEFSYHQQAALVAEGYEILTGNKMTSFSLVFVEKKPPYCVRIVTLKDCDLDRGRKQNHVALRAFANCLAANDWPGPGSADAEYLELPSWAQTRIDNQLQFLGVK